MSGDIVGDTALHPREKQKRQAALKALEHVQSGMCLGLGTGSTAKYAIEGLGERLASGQLQTISAVPTSQATATLAQHWKIPLVELPRSGVDVAIDGMDEVDDALNAIKGLGAALTREKIVASRAALFVLIGDSSKKVSQLGLRTPIPVEVLPFGAESTAACLEALGCRAVWRCDAAAAPVISDNGHYVYDCFFEAPDVHALNHALRAIPGVVEHGLFLGMAAVAYVADDEDVLLLRRPGV